MIKKSINHNIYKYVKYNKIKMSLIIDIVVDKNILNIGQIETTPRT